MAPPLAGLSTPCPRRRSPIDERRGGEGVGNPTSTPGRQPQGKHRCKTKQKRPFQTRRGCRVAHPSPTATRLTEGPSPWTKRGQPDRTSPLSNAPENEAFFRNTVYIYSYLRYSSFSVAVAPPVTPAMPRKRRRDPKQTTLAFRPAGRGGARPGAGRKRVRRSRVPHRARERIPGYCPVHVTLRVLDGLPGLRRAAFLRAFREIAAADVAAGVPGGALLGAGQPCALPGGGGGQGAAGQRDEELGGEIRAVRQPGVREDRQGAGGPFPPRG